MFKKCWSKKTPVEKATGILWQPIIEPIVKWPTNQQENVSTKVALNSNKSLENIDPLNNGQVQEDGTTTQNNTDVPYTTFENLENSETVINNNSIFASIINNNNKDNTTLEETTNVRTLETYVIKRPMFGKVINNNDVYEVEFSEQPTPPLSKRQTEPVLSTNENITNISKPDQLPTKVDDNANHIQINEEPVSTECFEFPAKTSTTSTVFRNTSESILSMISSDTHLSTSNEQMKTERRKGVSDDVELGELKSYQISAENNGIIKKALRENDFFMAVAPNVIDDIAQYMTYREVAEGDIIMKQGEQGNSLFVSKTGEFKIQMHKQTIKKFKGACLFGELAILYDKPRTATAIAMSNGSVWELERHIFKTLWQESNITANKNILDFLSQVPIINKASPHKLRKIAELCENRYYSKDTVIIREGQKGDEFFLVKTGEAVVSKAGRGKILTYSSGNYFGEGALLYDDDKRKATVTAVGYGVECLVLKRLDFHKYLGDVHTFLQEDIAPKTKDATSLLHAKPSADRLELYKPIKLGELKREKLLGEGGFGTVYQVKWNKKVFALKILKIQKVNETKTSQKVLNEKDIQIACDSMFIVQLYRTFKDEHNYYFLLEYCPRAELWPLIQRRRHFTDLMSRFTASCVLEALAYLHVRNYAYLDLKPENIFIDRDGYPKIGDFGNAVKLEPGKQIFYFAGTPDYMAPEIIQHKGTDMAADYWAYGVLIYEMLLGKAPFSDKDDKRLFDNIIKGLSGKHFPPNFNKPAKDLIKRLIDLNPAKRLGCLREGVSEVYKHDFFKDIEFEKLREKKLKSPLLSLYKN